MDQKEPTLSNDNQALQFQAETAGANVNQDAFLESPQFSILGVSRNSNRDTITRNFDI